jgi:rhodanese-related sulfurtransferase
MAMATLRLLGYTNVKSIGGGFNNWVKGGLPIVKPE